MLLAVTAAGFMIGSVTLMKTLLASSVVRITSIRNALWVNIAATMMATAAMIIFAVAHPLRYIPIHFQMENLDLLADQGAVFCTYVLQAIGGFALVFGILTQVLEANMYGRIFSSGNISAQLRPHPIPDGESSTAPKTSAKHPLQKSLHRRTRTLYYLMIRYRYLLCILGCGASPILRAIDEGFGALPAVIGSVIIMLIGILCFGLLMLYIRIGWNGQERPGILAAGGAAGAVGALISAARLLVMFRVLDPKFYLVIETLAAAGLLLVIFGFLWDLKVNSYEKGS
jgi:hypothetical protein